MTTQSAPEAGFVVLDALLAMLTLSLAGTVLVATAAGLIERERSTLDRSVTLVMAYSLMRQYPLLGDQAATDELYGYRASSRPYDGSAGLMVVDIEAEPLAPMSRGEEVMLSFLAVERGGAL